jgi:hypothetical protein
MSELLKKIRSRGYWKVVIHPAIFVENRVDDIAELYPILEKTSVQLRGWDFPHLDSRNQPHIDKDWIGQEIEWEHYLQLWRFYQSGQFVHFSGMTEDWVKESGLLRPYYDWSPSQFLSVKSAVFQFSEIFEFAARLALTEAGDEGMHIEVTISGLDRRELRLEDYNRMPFVPGRYKATIQKLPYKVDISRVQLVSEPREMALKPVVELFKRFGWNASLEILRDMQDELIHRGSRVAGR